MVIRVQFEGDKRFTEKAIGSREMIELSRKYLAAAYGPDFPEPSEGIAGAQVLATLAVAEAIRELVGD